jgi:hypothetical protein
MNVVMPAEAPLELYKCAYVVMRERNLRFSNLVIAYPQKGFQVSPTDVCLGMLGIERPDAAGKNFESLSETMQALRCQSRYGFLTHLPTQLLMCYREVDKTILATKLFDAFDAFRRNFDDQFALTDKIRERRTFTEGNYQIICADSKESFLTQEDRIALFKTGYQYIAFASDNTVGVQKTLHRHCPSLTEFAKFANLDPEIWFTHRLGHLVITKNSRTPNLSALELCEKLQEFLRQKKSVADAAE